MEDKEAFVKSLNAAFLAGRARTGTRISLNIR